MTDGPVVDARPAGDVAGPLSSPLLIRRVGLAVLDELVDQHRLFAVVDTAGDLGAYEYLSGRGDGARCLYAGTEGTRYAAIAPWLVQVDPEVNAWLAGRPAPADDPTTTDWGVYVVSRAAPHHVARQLRRWLTVRLADGGRVRFRFYDPRVLPDFLAASSHAELDAFFGRALEAFAVADVVTQELVVLTRHAAPVLLPTRRFAVSPPTQAPPALPGTRAQVAAQAPFPLGLARSDVR